MRRALGHGLEISGIALAVFGTSIVAWILLSLVELEWHVHGGRLDQIWPYGLILALPVLAGCALFTLGHRLMSADHRVFFRR